MSDAWPALLLLLGVLVATGFDMWRRLSARGSVRVFKRLGAFIQAVDATTRREDPGALARLNYLGVLPGGRRARIAIEPTALGRRLRFTVSTGRDVPSLRVRLEGVVERLQKRLGRDEDIHTGDRLFDQRFWLESTLPGKGRRALETAELRRAITAAFGRYGVEGLHMQPGELVAEADLATCHPTVWKKLLRHLDQVADLVETRPVKVRVLEAEHPVACGPDGHLRCAYCRDGLTGDEDDLVACERCRTALHGACWEEHGGCPMLGCEGDRAERPRARA